MDIACAQSKGVMVALEVIKTHDYVMQPVGSIENTVVTIQDLGKLGIVCRRKTGSDSVGKTYEEWISRGLESIYVAQLIGRSAGKLRSAVCTQPRSADSLRFRRIENAIEKRRIQPLEFIGSEKEDLILYYRTAQ